MEPRGGPARQADACLHPDVLARESQRAERQGHPAGGPARGLAPPGAQPPPAIAAGVLVEPSIWNGEDRPRQMRKQTRSGPLVPREYAARGVYFARGTCGGPCTSASKTFIVPASW